MYSLSDLDLIFFKLLPPGAFFFFRSMTQPCLFTANKIMETVFFILSYKKSYYFVQNINIAETCSYIRGKSKDE